MNLDLKTLLGKLTPLVQKLRSYATFIVFILFLGIFGFLVFRINSLVNTEPSEDAVLEGLQTIKRPRIDEDVVEKMQQLEETNIEVKSLFEQARDNPFEE